MMFYFIFLKEGRKEGIPEGIRNIKVKHHTHMKMAM
jgi:hypothetical protein